MPLHYDETYYWMMSKHLSLSYFDIPPVAVYMIWVSTTLFGDGEMFVRLPAIFSFSIALLYIYHLTKEVYNKESAFFTLVLISFLPYIQTGLFMITTDAPFFMFWSMGLYYGHKLFQTQMLKDYIILGAIIGLGLSSKYSMVLFIGGIGLYALIYAPKVLFHPYTLYTTLFATIGFLPVIIWNYQLDWQALIFRYNFGSTSTYEISSVGIKDFWGGIVLLATPIVFLYGLSVFYKRNFSKSEKFILFMGVLFLGFFFYKALFKSMALNWISPGVITLSIIVIARMVQNHKKIYYLSTITAFMFLLILKLPDQLGLSGHLNTKSKFIGFKEAVEYLEAKIPDKNALICSDYYSGASAFKYYTKGQNYRVIEPFTDERITDINIWNRGKEFNEDCYYFLSREANTKERQMCHSIELLDSYKYDNPQHKSEANFYLYRCVGFAYQAPTIFQ